MESSTGLARHGSIAERGAPQASQDLLAGRLGLTVPHEWWPSAPFLKSYEAAGFDWVQVDAPPRSVLMDPLLRDTHASTLGQALDTTGLRSVVHAPGGLRLGSEGGVDAFAGLLAYAAIAGAETVVYHALAHPDEPGAEDELRLEAHALGRLALRAEQLGVSIAVENLAPLYPGPETISANPLSLRGLVLRSGSDAVGICLDLGHAHVVAERRHTSLRHLVEPVLDLVTIFHAHDNLGSRVRPGELEAAGVDPLRLDLHLPPGRGTLPWDELAADLAEHDAPIVLEVHPPYRPRAAELRRDTAALLQP